MKYVECKEAWDSSISGF